MRKQESTLTDVNSPGQWQDWLHSIQASLIESGYCEGLTRRGSSEFANNFQALHQFFSQIKGRKRRKATVKRMLAPTHRA